MSFLALLAVLIFSISPSFSENAKDDREEEQETSTDLRRAEISFSFPINVTSAHKITLMASPGKGYRCLQSHEEILNHDTPLLEYVPQSDTDDYAWSEIFTMSKIIGQGVKAEDFHAKVSEGLVANTTHAKLLEKKVTQHEGYTESVISFSYELNGRKEVVLMHCYAGPMDLVNVQHAVLKKDKETDAEALKRTKDFLSSHTKLIQG